MKLELNKMILTSIFAALTAIGAFIKIQTPIVPFTMQFVFCAYAGLILGKKYGLFSQLLYIFIGLIGIPIFANGGGITYVFQPTFGYLIGFAIASMIIGYFTENKEYGGFLKTLVIILLGLFFVYFSGVLYLKFIMNVYFRNPMNLYKAISIGFFPYIPADFTLSILAAYSYKFVYKGLRKSGYLKIEKQ